LVALLSRQPVELDHPLHEYALQFFGITKQGRPVLQVVGTCPRLWVQHEALLREYPWNGMGLHTCGCYLETDWDPERDALRTVATGSCRD